MMMMIMSQNVSCKHPLASTIILANTHLHTKVETDNVEQSCLSKRHKSREQDSNHEPADLSPATPFPSVFFS